MTMLSRLPLSLARSSVNTWSSDAQGISAKALQNRARPDERTAMLAPGARPQGRVACTAQLDALPTELVERILL